MFDIKTQKIFIDPGVLPEDRLYEIIEQSAGNLSIITESKSLKDKYSEISKNVDVYAYPQLENNTPAFTDNGLDHFNIWSEIINDHQTYLLYDRAYFGFKSNQLKTADIVSDCIKCQAFIYEHKPEAIIFMATPHKLTTWIFARTAELMGVEAYYFQETIMPWRQYLYKGVSRKAELVKFGFYSSEDREAINGFIEAKNKGFNEAFPETEKVKLKRNKGKFYSLFSDIKNGWKRPDHVANKFFCNKKYASICHHGELPNKYIVFFLHYQPERTSLP